MTSRRPDETNRVHVAVVTGCARGIGQALASALAFRCRAVVGVDLLPQGDTADLVESAGAEWLGLSADISDPSQVELLKVAIEERFGGVDILVNNAGIDDPVVLDELDYERWRRVIAVDLDAPFLMTLAVVDGMKQRGWGRIINIATSAAEAPVPRFVAYRAAKMGVVGLTRALAAELGPFGITVNAVGPGVTRTEMALNSLGDDFEAISMMRCIPRVALPKDLAGTVLFLASADSAFVTGQTIMANGGATFA